MREGEGRSGDEGGIGGGWEGGVMCGDCGGWEGRGDMRDGDWGGYDMGWGLILQQSEEVVIVAVGPL